MIGLSRTATVSGVLTKPHVAQMLPMTVEGYLSICTEQQSQCGAFRVLQIIPWSPGSISEAYEKSWA